MIALTGPPRIDGIERRYPSLEGWMECVWDDSETLWLEYDDGHAVQWEVRVRLTGSCAWTLATEQEALALVSDLRGTFLVAPRTRQAGDPEWATEVEVLCRRTTPLPATRPIYLIDETDRPRWRVALDFESVVVFSSVPGTADGGWTLVAEDADSADLDSYGDAEEALEAYPLTFDGVDYATEAYRIGTPVIVAARVLDVDATTADLSARIP